MNKNLTFKHLNFKYLYFIEKYVSASKIIDEGEIVLNFLILSAHFKYTGVQPYLLQYFWSQCAAESDEHFFLQLLKLLQCESLVRL